MFATLMNRVRYRLARNRIRTGPRVIPITFLDCEMLIRPQEDVGRSMILREFETREIIHLRNSARDGDLVFDIGANVGAYCIPIAKANPRVQIVAFEPIPLNSALINVSVLVNRLPNVHVVQKCVTDNPGTVHFSIAADSAYSSMIDTNRKPEIERLTCEATSLDAYCRVTGRRPNIVKLDVEGAEMRVLQGAAETFSGPSRPRLVLMELYGQNLTVFDTSISAILEKMTDWGYRAFIFVDDRKVRFTPAHFDVHYNVFFEPDRSAEAPV